MPDGASNRLDEQRPSAAPQAHGAAAGRSIGRPMRRREDDALLRGQGRFVNDLHPQGCLSVAFLRSPYASGRVAAIDTAPAASMPGVRGVFTAADLDLPGTGLQGAGAVNTLAGSLVPYSFPVMAGARGVEAEGQVLAAVVADSETAAQDAAERVRFEIADAPARPPAGHFAEEWRTGPPEPAAPAVSVSLQVRHARLAAMPMEPRAALAAWDDAAGTLTAWLPTQTPHRARADLARILGMDAAAIRVIAPDVGGAFGAKASLFPEDVVVAWAARHLRAAVAWRGSRAEDLLAGTHGRGLRSTATLGLDADGRMVSLQAEIEAPLGAWMPYSAVVPGRNAGRILPGPYAVPAVAISVSGRTGPTAPMGIYRGAGRPEAAMLMERLADEAARRLGMDPVAFRRRNLLPPARAPIPRPTGEVLDSGDLAALLDRAVALSGYDALRDRQLARRAAGAWVGIGVALYLEPCGQGWESAAIRLAPGGRFVAATGSSSQGQGRETAFAQIVADALGVAPETVEVRHGDTALTPPGIGALASRSTGIGGGALVRAAEALLDRAAPVAARLLQAGPEAVAPVPGGFARRDGSLAVVRWEEIAAASPLEAEAVFHAAGEAWSSGCCIAALSIDPETCVPLVERITLVDDAGTVVNPLLLEGQLLGGMAQGVGEALLERIVYRDGQLLTGSLMDYALPRAADIPPVVLDSLPHPTPVNPLGAKGVGEAGCIGVPAAIVNAAVDALSPFGVRHLDMPLRAETIWREVRGLKPREEDH